MAKKNKGQLSLDFKDERVPKLFGLLLILLSFYLFIAITSYLFTWDVDHDHVFRFSIDLLWEDIEVENWLGRLGAVVSDSLVYWGFGIASYFLVIILYKLGIYLLNRHSGFDIHTVLRRNVIWMVVVSVLLGFVFQKLSFPWGGTFGQSVSSYIQNLLGVFGTIILLIFSFLGMMVWNNNPTFDTFTWNKFVYEIKRAFSDIAAGNYGKAQPSEASTRARRNRDEEADFDIIEPAIAPIAEPRAEAVIDMDTNVAMPIDRNVPAAPPITVNNPKEKTPEADLVGLSGLFEAAPAVVSTPTVAPLRPGDATLEINEPFVPKPPEEPEQRFKPPVELVQEDNPNASEPYDPTLDLSFYEFPHLQLLSEYDNKVLEIDREELEENKNQIIQTLLNFKIEIEKIRATIGPTVTLYEIVPARGVRISKIKNLEDDIALSLSALGIRIIAPIPGKGTIGIEVPNKNKQIVGMKEVLMSEKFKRAKMDIPIALGKTISNDVFVADLARMPHLLIAGATGQGKSVGINVILMSILYKKHPSQVKLILIDPKKVELFPYARLENHFLGFLPDQKEPIVTDTSKVVQTLNSLTIEMDNRYDLLKKAEVRNINEYNEKFIARRLNPNKGHQFLPFIVIVIDEFADLIMTAGKEVELPLGRIAQLARAVGIHMIIATQRPSVNIITGVIKANFPARIAYKVASKVDSRTILDTGGAEQLIGRGDLLLSIGGDVIRLQSAFVDTPEVDKVIEFISNQTGFPHPFFLPEFHPDGEEGGGGKNKDFNLSELDDHFEEAAKLIVETQHGSTSMIQRRMKLGFNRAGRIMDQLESLGIVGPAEGSKPREVLYFSVEELDRFLIELRKRR